MTLNKFKKVLAHLLVFPFFWMFWECYEELIPEDQENLQRYYRVKINER